MEKLALLGGKPLLNEAAPEELFKWPVITKEDEEAVLEIVRTNGFSNFDRTIEFQDQFAKWQGRKYALAFTNGTMSLAAAMFAIGLGAGDEIICTTKTYWASIVQASTLGATPVFCNIGDDLNMDPADLERCLSPRTKAIMVVHYAAYPCDMDAIMEFANKHNLYVIEDVSHAHGSLYKGKKCGNFGHIAAMSMMSMKTFAAGEMGMVVTDDVKLYERAMAYGHYERNNAKWIKESPELHPYSHIPLGGVKGRVNQVSAVLGMGQLKYFDERLSVINKAMNYFFDLIEGVPGIKPRRCDTSDGSYMGGFYCPLVTYHPEELGGLSVGRFREALNEELGGVFKAWEGANFCLHNHEYFKSFDFFGLGKPTRIAFEDRDVREDDACLAPSDKKYCLSVPCFRVYDEKWIELIASAYKKVAENYEQLLENDTKEEQGGRWHGFENTDEQKKKK